MRFNLKEKVRIVELNRTGIIKSIFISESGTQYQVRYFDNAEAKTIYFYEEELESK